MRPAEILSDNSAMNTRCRNRRCCHVAGLKTVAEFVENTEIMRALGDIGVDYAQGYALARPAPVEELIIKASKAQD